MFNIDVFVIRIVKCESFTFLFILLARMLVNLMVLILSLLNHPFLMYLDMIFAS
jgi:hypothetical protein